MQRSNYGRHLPAFLLLFLAKAPATGAMLIQALETELPCNLSDGPAIYRTLNELEKAAALTSSWDTSGGGAPKKWYAITEEGYAQLRAYQANIEERILNLNYFLDQCKALDLKGGGGA